MAHRFDMACRHSSALIGADGFRASSRQLPSELVAPTRTYTLENSSIETLSTGPLSSADKAVNLQSLNPSPERWRVYKSLFRLYNRDSGPRSCGDPWVELVQGKILERRFYPLIVRQGSRRGTTMRYFQSRKSIAFAIWQDYERPDSPIAERER
jgi:hypothetical protein